MSKQTDDEAPRSLYHYTTARGLLGILKEKNIWATHINYMNDKKEFIDAMEAFTTQIKKLIPMPTRTYHEAVAWLPEIGRAGLYVSSFSEYAMRDQLSQWRGYCANGAGFSIGFNLAKLKELAKREKHLYAGTLKKCIYDPKAKARQIERIIKGAESKKLMGHDLLMHMIWTMMGIAPYFKDESFREEKEWRLAFARSEKVLFREGDTLLIPYVEFDLKDDDGSLPIENIVIGPTPNMVESHSSLQLLLFRHKIKATIEESKIPYRPGLSETEGS